jgi:hypothetical protein
MKRALGIWLSTAVLAGAAGTAAAQTVSESPQQNVRQSQQYEELVCKNPAFRANRIDKECGPLQGSQFYDSCVASFNCNSRPSGANWRKAPPSERIR